MKRESAARWCSTCDEWREHETSIKGDLTTGEEVEIISCSGCRTVAERRKLDPVEPPPRRASS